jgi:uncharacterized OsmC-like protein
MPASRVNVRELQAPLKEQYRADPNSATIVLRVRNTRSDLSDPLHCSVSPESCEAVWHSGAHPGVGGVGDVACSADILLGALVACQEVTMRMVAAAMGIEIESLEIEATGTLDLRGTMGVSREVPIGMQAIECRTQVSIKDDGRPDRAQRLLENAERYCVVLDTLRSGVPVTTTFTVGSADDLATDYREAVSDTDAESEAIKWIEANVDDALD